MGKEWLNVKLMPFIRVGFCLPVVYQRQNLLFEKNNFIALLPTGIILARCSCPQLFYQGEKGDDRFGVEFVFAL